MNSQMISCESALILNDATAKFLGGVGGGGLPHDVGLRLNIQVKGNYFPKRFTSRQIHVEVTFWETKL